GRVVRSDVSRRTSRRRHAHHARRRRHENAGLQDRSEITYADKAGRQEGGRQEGKAEGRRTKAEGGGGLRPSDLRPSDLRPSSLPSAFCLPALLPCPRQRSPHRNCSTAIAATGTASARSVRRPSVTRRTPCACADVHSCS